MTIRKLRCVAAAFVLGLFNMLYLPVAQASDCDDDVAVTLDDSSDDASQNAASFNPRRHSDLL